MCMCVFPQKEKVEVEVYGSLCLARIYVLGEFEGPSCEGGAHPVVSTMTLFSWHLLPVRARPGANSSLDLDHWV